MAINQIDSDAAIKLRKSIIAKMTGCEAPDLLEVADQLGMYRNPNYIETFLEENVDTIVRVDMDSDDGVVRTVRVGPLTKVDDRIYQVSVACQFMPEHVKSITFSHLDRAFILVVDRE